VFELYFAHFAHFSAADDVRLCNLCGLVDNYHEREIKYEGFGGRPSVGVRPGPPAPSLNPALLFTRGFLYQVPVPSYDT